MKKISLLILTFIFCFQAQAQVNWTSRTSAADNDWNGVTYGNGLFVAVAGSGTGNRVMTSPDGISWTLRATPAGGDWYAVTYGNGLFVAVAGAGTGARVMTSSDGINWTTQTAAAANDWRSVTYANGLFVAVGSTGTGNRVMTSPDGITWTARISAADNNWSGVVYGNGLFVAVAYTGTGNRVMTSPDGITWTARSSSVDNAWYGITYGKGLFVATAMEFGLFTSGSGNRVMTSPDGITWTTRTSAADNNWYSVTYGNGLFVALSDNGTNRVMTSPDGITWTSEPAAVTNAWYGITYGNGLFVAVSATGEDDRVMTSNAAVRRLTIDAIANPTYTGSALTPAIVVKDGTTTLTLGTDYTVAYSDNTNVGTPTVTITGMGNYSGTKTQTFAIVAKAASTLTIDAIATQTYTGSALTPAIVVKDDATTLTLGTHYSAAYTNNTSLGTATVTITGMGNYTGTKTRTFAIVAKAASTLMIDAIANQTYTGAALTPAIVVKDDNTTLTLGTHYSAAYTNNTSLGTATVTITGMGNYSGTKTQTFAIVAKAASTLTIDAIANPTYTGSALTPAIVVKDGTTTLTLGTDYTVAYSDNTNEGTATVTITGLGNYTGTKTQTFGITIWSSRTSAASNTWRSVTYGNGLFVAVSGGNGTGNRVMTSPDGISWTARTSAADNNWRGVTYGNGLFVAVSSRNGTALNLVMTSPDGITWTSRTSAGLADWYGITYGNGLFVTVASSGTSGTNRVMTSPDGINWTSQTAAVNNSWYGITYANGLFVAVAVSGTGNCVMTSPDGITWTSRTSAADSNWNSVTYGNGLFVAVAFSGIGNLVMTSPDGITWTARTSAAGEFWSSVTYGNGLFVAVAQNGVANRVMTSPDGITWTSRPAADNGNGWVAVTYGKGRFVSVAYYGTVDRVMTTDAAVSRLTIDPIANQTYTGAAITPTVVVKDGNTNLTLGTDYSVACTNNTNVGTATLTITGMGTYIGTKTQTFVIVAKAASTLTIDPIINQIYTGAAIIPSAIVKDGNTTLTLGTDYSVSCYNNTNVGAATLTITGIGNYIGTKDEAFNILPKAVNTLSIETITNLIYTGAAITPLPVVKDGNTTLLLGTDYSVSCYNNTNAGTAKLTITGIGNYTSTKDEAFNILPKALTVQANSASKIYGDANPSLSFTYSGLVDGDTEIDQAPSISTSATTISGVGIYSVTLTGGADPNYSLTLVEGVLEVSPAPLSLAINAATKIYGQADPAFTYSLQGLKGSDTDAVLVGAFSREAGEDPGTYRINQGSISAGGNYTLTVTGANLQILKARALSVAELALVTTEWSKEAALPATVNLLSTHGQYFRVEVKWDKSVLNLLARGTYSLIGTLILPAGIENPDQVLAKIKVQVLPKPAPRDVTITNSTFVGSTSVFFIPVGGFVVTDPVDKIHVVSLLGKGYDNRYFEIKDNILFWNSADRAPGRTSFSIVIRVTDRDGNTLDKFFEIKRTRPDFSLVTIYNTFTPNGDRFNDTWAVPELRFYEGARISVYERGGSRVFYTENPDIRWDGTYKGKELPIGSYYWVIQIDETGETRRGMVNLIRK